MTVAAKGRTVAVVTGTRAEFGLLAPVMRAIREHPGLELRVLVAGCHLLPPQRTADEVAAAFDVAAEIPMQRADATRRWDEAAALGRGVSGFAGYFAEHPPDVVVVLGDRVEAFAAAAAAAVGGVHVAHLHGGDRAAGLVDEGLRHAVSKLAHLHLAATERSAQRLVAMGEEAYRVHVVGSPAVDGLREIPPLDDAAYAELGRPEIVFMMHPLGRAHDEERAVAQRVLDACRPAGRVLALHPNHDPGRDGILAALADGGDRIADHLPRDRFVGLLRRARALVGNSSAGLIECAALGVPAINVGPRQAGRERADNVIDVDDHAERDIARAVNAALTRPQAAVSHAYDGPPVEGTHGVPPGPAARTAGVLASFDRDRYSLVKRNAY